MDLHVEGEIRSTVSKLKPSPSAPSTRLPSEIRKRNHIMHDSGIAPIKTPAICNGQTTMPVSIYAECIALTETSTEMWTEGPCQTRLYGELKVCTYSCIYYPVHFTKRSSERPLALTQQAE